MISLRLCFLLRNAKLNTCPSLPFKQERGGIMSLTEVYCLVNRARGMEVRMAYFSGLLANGRTPPIVSIH